MKKNTVQNGIKKLALVSAVAFLLELFVFNFSAISLLLNPGLIKNMSYSLKDMKKINWKSEGDHWISESDPMLILSSLDQEVKTARILIDAEDPFGVSTVFYTTNQGELFSEKGMMTTDLKKRDITLDFNKKVKDLRIDVTENAGLTLRDITLIINPMAIHFSFSRIIAVLFIYWGTVGLFGLQKSPEYYIEQKKED